MNTFKKLLEEMLNREGLKAEVNAAQMREILSLLSAVLYENPEAIAVLIKNGQKKCGQ